MADHLPIDASILAVALWSPANQRAANFVGANMMNGWAHAARIWPENSQIFTNSGDLWNTDTFTRQSQEVIIFHKKIWK